MEDKMTFRGRQKPYGEAGVGPSGLEAVAFQQDGPLLPMVCIVDR